MATRKEGDERRGEIVRAALDLLATTSLESLSTRGIAKKLGLSQPALFRHFRSKDALLLAVVRHAEALLAARALPILSGSGRAEDKVRALFAELLAEVERMPGLPRLLFADAASASKALRPALVRLVATQTSLATELAKEAVREGSVRADVDPSLLGGAVVALVQGSTLAWQLASRRTPLSGPALARLELVLAGASPREAPRSPGRKRARRAPRKPPLLVDATRLLASGQDPLGAALAAVEQVGPGGAVLIRAPFRPTPLVALLGGRGHGVEVREVSGGAFEIEVAVRGEAPVRRAKRARATERAT